MISKLFGRWKVWQLLTALFLVLAVAVTVVFADSAAKPAILSFSLITGEVVTFSSETCVIKEATGKTLSFKVDGETKMIGPVQEGDQVEVYVSPDGRVLYISRKE
jgi:hypothetical protein